MRFEWICFTWVLCDLYLGTQSVYLNVDSIAIPVEPSNEVVRVIQEGEILQISSKNAKSDQEILAWNIHAPNGTGVYVTCPDFPLDASCNNSILLVSVDFYTSKLLNKRVCNHGPNYLQLPFPLSAIYVKPYPDPEKYHRCLIATKVVPIFPVEPPPVQLVASGTLKPLENDPISGLPQFEIRDGLLSNGKVLCGSNTSLQLDTLYVVHSPLYPKPYPSNITCNWKLEAPVGTTVSVMCQDYDLPSCEQGDYLTFTEMPNRLLDYCGIYTPDVFITRKNVAELAFKGISSDFRGFTCTAKVLTEGETVAKCGYNALATSQDVKLVLSTSFPRNFNPFSACRWAFQAPEEHTLRINCPIFELSDSCSEDYLSYARFEDSYQPQSICGKRNNFTVETVGKFLLLQFALQSANLYRGFYCTVRAIPPTVNTALLARNSSIAPLTSPDISETNLDCNQQITLPETGMAVIQSPGYPNKYASGTNCTWKVQTVVNHFVLMTCTYVDLPNNCADRITLRVSGNPNAKPWTVCKSNSSSMYISKTSLLSVEFLGTTNHLYSGFKCSVISIAQDTFKLAPCSNVTLLKPSHDATFVSPGYPSKAPKGASCSWSFVAPPEYQIRFFCPIFNISDGDDRSRGCSDDSLNLIRGGPGNTTTTMCGNGPFRKTIADVRATVNLPPVQNTRSERLFCFARAVPVDPSATYNVTPALLDPMTNQVAQTLALDSGQHCPMFIYAIQPYAYALATSPGQHYLTPGGAEDHGALSCYTKFTSTDPNRHLNVVCNVNRLSTDCRETVSVKYLDKIQSAIPFCGNNLTSTVTNTGSQQIEVKFHSPAAPRPETQFQCYVFSMHKAANFLPCNVDATLNRPDDEVYIATPNFPNGYGSNDGCTWNFKTDQSLGFAVFCPVFDLPIMLPCGDRLTLQTSNSTNRYCSKQPLFQEIKESSFSIEFNPILESSTSRGGVICLIRAVAQPSTI